jgi:hypothetical protein
MTAEARKLEAISIEERILSLTIDKCHSRFESFAKLENIEVKPCSASAIGFDVDRRSEILLYGVELTIRFQTFYSDANFAKHLKGTFENPSMEQVHDFFNELGNLTLGKMKEVFIANKLNVALSLPVSVSTSKARVLESPHILTSHGLWTVKQKNQTLFYAYVSLEIHKNETLNNFDENLGNQNSGDGDIELF